MIAKQSVYLNLDRDTALPEGHADAKFLLVRAGQEISDNELSKYEGADDLASEEAEVREVVPIPPPNLKKHSDAKEKVQAVPEPTIKSSDGKKKAAKAHRPDAAPKSQKPKTDK